MKSVTRITSSILVVAALTGGAIFGCSKLKTVAAYALSESKPAASVEVGDLVTLKSNGHAVTWVVEPEVPYVAYGADTENLVTSFKLSGSYFVYAASINSDAGTSVERFPISVTGGAAPSPTNNLDLKQYMGPKADALKLAASFKAVANSVQVRLDNGILVTPAQIISETAAANKNALGSGVAAWNSYFDNLQKKLQASNLQSMPEHIKTWLSLAAELEAYAK